MKTTKTTTEKPAKKAAFKPVQKTTVAKKKPVAKPKAEKLTEVEPLAEIEPKSQADLPETALPEVEKKPESKIDRKIVNGIRMPKPESGAGKLWTMLDRLLEDKGRAPARFEFREAVSISNEERLAIGVNLIHPDTASVQYFLWRKFYGIKARESGLHPKRNSFEVSIPVTYVKKEREGKCKAVA